MNTIYKLLFIISTRY